MIQETLAVVAVAVLAVSTLVLLLSQNWRLSIIALSLQYLAVFFLVLLVWPLGQAAVKLVVGWMAGAVLGSSQPDVHLKEVRAVRGSIFLYRFFIAMLVWVMVISLSLVVIQLVPLPAPLVTGAMLLIGMGLAHLGISTRPLRVLLGLLTTLAGFELLYAAIERSILVTGLLAIVTLGLALTGSYLFEILPGRQEAE